MEGGGKGGKGVGEGVYLKGTALQVLGNSSRDFVRVSRFPLHVELGLDLG